MTRGEISEKLDIGLDFLFLDSFEYNGSDGQRLQQSGADESFLARGFGRHTFIDNSFTKAHFLSKQVVPASLLLESIFQCTAMTIYNHLELPKGVHALIVSVSIDLRRAVEVGHEIEIQSKIERVDRGIIRCLATCHSDEKTICNAQLKYWYPIARIN